MDDEKLAPSYLFTIIIDTMKKLESGQISNDTAFAQAKLARQANNALRYGAELLVLSESDRKRLAE